MVKATKKNNTLNRTVIVSFVLHVILIALLVWGSLQENIMSAGGSDGSVFGAVMVDANAVVEQYNREQQRDDAKRAEKLRQKKAQQHAAELQQKQAAEQQRLKSLEKERLAMKEKTAKQAKILAEQQKAAAKAKYKAAAEKQSAEVDDLFDGLSDGKNAPAGGRGQKGDVKLAWQDHAKAAGGGGGADIDSYMGKIQGAIQSKFYDPSGFTGKTCDLRIKLAPHGLLISVQEVDGDPALCQAAVSAAKLAKIPKPPSDAVYQYFKNFTLGFKPQ